jgi:hypothetical protein
LATESSKLALIQFGIAQLFKPGQLIEFRVQKTDKVFRGFYFDDHDKLADIVSQLDDDPRVVSLYYVINPIKPSLIRLRAECQCDKCKSGSRIVLNPSSAQVEQILTGGSQHLTADDEVELLQNVLIDFDTIRAPYLKLDDSTKEEFSKLQHECSTAEEKRATREVAKRAIAYLDVKGWPSALLADSGNGYHVVPRVQMDNSVHNANMLLDVRKALAARFNCDEVKIDASVGNPSRLTRAYGTMTRKGTSTEERPYRRNQLIQTGVPVQEVPLDLILNMASELPGSSNRRKSGSMPVPVKEFDPQDYFEWFATKENHPRLADNWKPAFEIVDKRRSGDVMYHITDTCLIAGHRHTGSDVTGFGEGKSFGYHCFSSDCEGITLKDLHAKLYEDGYERYDQPIFERDVEEEYDVLALTFGLADAKDGEAEAAQQEEEEIDKAMAAPVVLDIDATTCMTGLQRMPVLQPVADEAPEPKDDLPAYSSGSKALDSLGEVINKLATHMLSVIFHHPTEVWQDGFIHFTKRIKIKLGFNAPWKKLEDGEAPQQTLQMPIGEVLRMLIKFTETHKRLPDKVTFKHFLDVSTDPEVAKNNYKDEMKKYVDGLDDQPASTFDMTAIAFVDKLDLRSEIDAWRTSFNHFLLKEHDIVGARTQIRKHFNISTTQGTNFEQGSWQERTDAIYADFEKNIRGVGDERKFILGFPSIDKSGMNIGLDGDHAICLCGPASNRKTTAALSMAMNFAIQGKNGLFFAGEHQCMKVLKRLTLQLSHFFKDDPEIGKIPGLSKWEGLNRTATEEDLQRVKALLLKLKAGDSVPGFIEPQNIAAVTRGEEDKVGALLQYAEATYPKYQWDFIVIDPLDTIMPTEVIGNTRGASNWKICSGIVDRLFDFSRNAFGGKGCMVIVTAQFGSDARREIEKIQEKNAGMENFDDQLESILRRDGLIQYFTTIGQRFDLALGVATRTKDGNEGLIVRGRDREGGTFNACSFDVDPDTNYMREKKRNFKVLEETAPETTQIEAFDVL